MSDVDQNKMPRGVLRIAAAGAAAALLAGCSSDVSRFAEGPFGADYTPTASIGSAAPASGSALLPPDPVRGAYPAAAATPAASGQQPYQTAYRTPAYPMQQSAAIQSAPLAPPSAAVRSSGVAPAMPTRPNYGAPVAAPQSAGAGVSFGPWTSSGGPSISVGENDTASSLAARYGVPQEALLKVNGLSSAAQVRPGARLTVPVYNANVGGRSTPAAAPATPPVRSASSARPEPKGREVAEAKKRETRTQEANALAKRKAEAEKRRADAKAEADRKALAAKKAKDEARKKHAAVEEKASEPQRAQEEAPRKVQVAARTDVDTSVKSADGKPEFRWPARGRIIRGFKSGSNDGINIAVPEGTSVKAAESGVVAYAGSELKGFGNLVLIRHPNGYVSAYAHNGSVTVKRGDTVTRGQTIARSGQSGNVASPQLHFELRKGSTPVDPTSYLAGL